MLLGKRLTTIFAIVTILATSTLANKDWATEKKADCPRIGEVPWMGSCQGDYATVTASWLEDMICLAVTTNASAAADVKAALKKVRISYQDIICSCDECHNKKGNGCLGGNAKNALDWMRNNGVAGGSEKSFDDPIIVYPPTKKPLKFQYCLNYFTAPCSFKGTGAKYPLCTKIEEYHPVNSCPTECNRVNKVGLTQGPVVISKLVKDNRTTSLINTQIQKSTGLTQTAVNESPVIGFMEIFEDIYLNDGEQIYVHTAGQSLGMHAVKIIGYKETNGVKYWIVVLPLGKDVGKDGVVKVLKDVNHCNIEDSYLKFNLSKQTDGVLKDLLAKPAP